MSFYIKDKGWFESSGASMGSQRKMTLTIARRCGFEDDTKTFTRLLVERPGRVGWDALQEAWRAGAALRKAEVAS